MYNILYILDRNINEFSLVPLLQFECRNVAKNCIDIEEVCIYNSKITVNLTGKYRFNFSQAIFRLFSCFCSHLNVIELFHFQKVELSRITPCRSGSRIEVWGEGGQVR